MEEPSVYQLAYVSHSRSSLDPAMLTDILSVSKRNNTRDGITGVMMYHDELFFQVLEGERSLVENCYFERIRHDPRHRCLSIAWSDFAERRSFTDWAMGYAGPDEIGKHTNHSFRSLNELRNDECDRVRKRSVVLELARVVFSEFQQKCRSK